MHHDWSLHLLDRIADATEETAAASKRTRREVGELRKEVEALVTWIKRWALLAALWGSGAALHLTSDQVVEIALAFLKAR